MQYQSPSRHAAPLLLAIIASVLAAIAAPSSGQVLNGGDRIILTDIPDNDNFGSAIASTNGIVAIGAIGDEDNGPSSGSVYLFNTITGQQISKLLPNEASSYEFFGRSLALSNEIIAVGARDAVGLPSNSGVVYLFDISTGTQLARIQADDTQFNDLFGSSIAIENNLLVVGAPGDDDQFNRSGSVYIFDLTTNQQIAKLHANDPMGLDGFGASVAIQNGIVAVGSPHSVFPTSFTGAAYLFDAQTGTQLAKLTANDAAPNDRFGVSIAIDQGKVIVGASGKNSNIGSAYIFDIATGTQLVTLNTNDSHPDQFFGSSVRIQNNIVAIGAWGDLQNGSDAGAAYLFDATTGVQLAKVLPEVPPSGDEFGFAGDEFGRSIDINNGTLVVGAAKTDDTGFNAGSTYIFSVPNATQTSVLFPNDLPDGDRIGAAIAIGGNFGVVGSDRANDHGTDSGSAFIFRKLTGSVTTRITPDDGAPGDRFGNAVDTDSNIIAVGARGDDDNGPESGSVYLFSTSPGLQLNKLLPDDGAPLGFFGWSVAIDNNIIAVGAIGDDDNGPFAGAAYLFDATTGNQIAKLIATDGQPNDSMGISIDIDNGLVVVGAWGDGDNGSGSGSAYLFDAATGAQLAKLLPDDGAPGDQFGNAVAIFNGVVAVAAWQDQDLGTASGSVYLFDAATGNQFAKLLPDNGSAGDQFGISLAMDMFTDTGIDFPVILVGADQSNNQGAAYIFDATTAEQYNTITTSEGNPGDEFGTSVDINNGNIAIGAPQSSIYGPDSGSAYRLDINVIVNDCVADINNDGSLNFFDISAFIFAFSNLSPIADITGDGSFNAFDISAFLAAFAAGCP
jgi:FG-GAP repeat protein